MEQCVYINIYISTVYYSNILYGLFLAITCLIVQYCRLSTELAALCSQQNDGAIETKQSDSNLIQQNVSIAEESESDHNQQSVRWELV